MKKLFLFFLVISFILISACFTEIRIFESDYSHFCTSDTVFDRDWRYKYKDYDRDWHRIFTIENGDVDDQDWYLRYPIRDDGAFDRLWQVQSGRIYDRD